MTYEEFHTHFRQRLQERGIQNPAVVLSVRGVGADNPEGLDEVAVKGRVQFFLDYESFWGEGKDYLSDVITDPTWLDVAYLADEMIRVTGDGHHVFLEDIREAEPKHKTKHLQFGKSTYRDRKKDPSKGAKMYTFIMGS